MRCTASLFGASHGWQLGPDLVPAFFPSWDVTILSSAFCAYLFVNQQCFGLTLSADRQAVIQQMSDTLVGISKCLRCSTMLPDNSFLFTKFTPVSITTDSARFHASSSAQPWHTSSIPRPRENVSASAFQSGHYQGHPGYKPQHRSATSMSLNSLEMVAGSPPARIFW